MLRAYLSIAVLVGLGANAVIGWCWADAIAALLVAVACLAAGTNAWRGQPCDATTC